MALYRLSACVSLACLMVTGCGNPAPAGRTGARPVVEALPETKATADVDKRLTLALKQALLTQFPQNSPTQAIETRLSLDGFTCDTNPSAPNERACLKAVRKDACEINTIVRTSPYSPDKAQVIRICEVDAPASVAK